jgi:hypothetical protein
MPKDIEIADTNLVEYIAAVFGFAKLSRILPGKDIKPSYLFVGFFSFFDLAVLQIYVHFTGGIHILVKSPNTAIGYVAVILGVFGIEYMSNEYTKAISAIRVHERIENLESNNLQWTISWRRKVFIYIAGVITLYAHAIFNVGIPDKITAINLLFTWQFVLLPVIIEFSLSYISIHIQFPRQIKSADMNMFFYDPRNMGGFAAVGTLLKRSYYLYTAALLMFFVFAYGRLLLSLGSYEPGWFDLLFFSTAWFIGVLSIGHSMYTIHQFMSEEKEQRIREIEDELHEALENPYEINKSRVDDPEKLEDARRRLEQVKNTRVYPATFTMWSQIAISVFLPQLLQLTVQATF